ncbi:MAG: flagellar M-ring protein FliF [Treponema sp.]|nr:flagellar M-ring protein FliF [Treponema sp.]MBQ7881243.1 flagellar M-ring protein FliF [Treponema sp.]
MNEWLKNTIAKLKELWGKWKPIQKVILAGIIVVVIIAIFMAVRFSAAPSMVPLFNTPITDQKSRDDITYRLDEENIKYVVSQSGVISVADETTARRLRGILIRENLVPTTVDPFSLFDVTSWSTTDFERNVNLQRSITRMVTQHLEALDDIASANVVITAPEEELFTSNQKPVTASVILYFKPGSDMPTNRKKLKGVQDLVLRAVVGLTEDNLTISDSAGNILNDFKGMAESDAVDIVKKQQDLRHKEEVRLSAKVLNALRRNFNEDRVRDVVVAIEMDMSKVTSDQTIYTPIIITDQDPDKPYDTTEKRDYLPISSQTVTKEWTGTGYNPEGPAGVEGQNPPVYSDMSNVIGKSTETGVTQNNVVNTEQRHVEKAPSYDRITASANIDGYWDKETDGRNNPVFVTEKNYEELKEKYSKIYNNPETNENIRFKMGHIVRVYNPVSDRVIEQAENFVKDAIGYNKDRGDSVTINSWAIPREDEWNAEDADIIRKQNTQKTIVLILAGTAVVLIAFIIFRFISRELERRRRLREEEILRRQQAEREKALWDAKQDGMEVTMSVEERKRAELQENAIAMAKEHPEDVAMLIRTWLMEE